jgi:hypothetical protein
MSFNLLCALKGHKWTIADATNEPGVRMVCQRCGRPQGSRPLDGPPGENPADKRKDVGGIGGRL